jgi:glyoxylase-like metal-dependent hydrolase (beta-lactamase superfamily II)
VIIDPGDEPQKILAQIKDGSKPVSIVNTHGHPDHVGANAPLAQKFKLPIYIHQEDAGSLSPVRMSLANVYTGLSAKASQPSHLLAGGEEIRFGNNFLKVIHTPGHTRGGICLYIPGHLFSGDTLFYEEVGRTDLPGGSDEALIKGIKEKLFILPPGTVVYPGHGPSTTIGHEKEYNPWVGGKAGGVID